MKLSFYKYFAAISGFSAVALGAFAAHGLKPHLSAYAADIWQTAVFYQFVHTLLLLAVVSNSKLVELASQQVSRFAAMLSAGIILFSGSLYLIALTGYTKLGMVTPIGGLLFLASWLYLIKLFKHQSE